MPFSEDAVVSCTGVQAVSLYIEPRKHDLLIHREKLIRKNFGKRPGVLKVPYLLKI
jgi:hypothetical protein